MMETKRMKFIDYGNFFKKICGTSLDVLPQRFAVSSVIFKGKHNYLEE